MIIIISIFYGILLLIINEKLNLNHFVRDFSRANSKPIGGVDNECLEALKARRWPGNARELRNVIERAVILSEDGTLRVPRLESRRSVESSHSGGNTLNEMERDYIWKVLDEANWVIGGPSGAARRLGLPRTTLISKMKKLGVRPRPSARDCGADRASLPV